MLDAAVVRYDENPGIYYQHGLIRDGFIIIEKNGTDFLGLPNGRKVTFSIESIDEGLRPYLTILFEKDGNRQEFSDGTQKSLSFTVPDYDKFTVRVRMAGSGATRLIAVSANLTDD
ncbi:hypothetical protein Hs20B_13430 [Lactococcus insecticola]|uniref:Uncharacterized protein n=2 Tax=Pseudolactococcus insecticola TaxID=2709158 RepID=A0A6A0B821_9LACT|nr:hypothetical protein Hs20B_13430 [Lactococcus insecticola]